jgi:vacuolar-type H+-ATPase subunit E/Vma4
MALADILAAMEAHVDAEIHQIEQQTAATIAQIRAVADDEARTIRERHHREALAQLQHERARRLNRAQLRARTAASRARERLFADALAGARAQLADVRAGRDYAAQLRALAEEALAQIDGESLLHADPRDEALLRALFPRVQITADLSTWGGVEARTLDGRIVVVNTLEARLQQAQNMLRPIVLSFMEGQTDPCVTTTMLTPDFVRWRATCSTGARIWNLRR